MPVTARKLALIAALLAFWPETAWAPVRRILTYQEMVSKADLVAIATPVARRELKEPTSVPGMKKGGEPIAVVGIETTFQVVVELKPMSSSHDTSFTLWHYRLRDPKENLGWVPLPPQVIDFEPTDRSQYLMFLRKRDERTYEPYDIQQPMGCIERLSLPFRE